MKAPPGLFQPKRCLHRELFLLTRLPNTGVGKVSLSPPCIFAWPKVLGEGARVHRCGPSWRSARRVTYPMRDMTGTRRYLSRCARREIPLYYSSRKNSGSSTKNMRIRKNFTFPIPESRRLQRHLCRRCLCRPLFLGCSIYTLYSVTAITNAKNPSMVSFENVRSLPSGKTLPL